MPYDVHPASAAPTPAAAATPSTSPALAGAAGRSTLWLALPFTLVWASAFPAAKFVFPDSPPLLFLSLRFVCAGLLLTAWAAWRGEFRQRRPGLRDWATLLALALLGHALYLGVSWTGMRQLSSGLATIIISASPIAVALLAAALLGEPLTRRKLLGLALGLGGVAFIVRHRLHGGADTAQGLLLVLLALASLSLGTVLYKRLPLRIGLVANAGLQMLLAGLLLAPVALALENPAELRLTPTLLGAFAWLLGVVSLMGYLMWFTLLGRHSASAASAWFFLTPPLGLLMGWAVLGEPLSLPDLLGIVPVAIGIALVTRAPAR
ncbi:DMT family transporter [Vandammella animalimorsus]|uniref:EamA family transporter n=1 Tax=Vandammella animalimorsus TaxID=2029117 RepID=A0A2A2A7A2_9BURK|nr:DMT family transporter [Vandammella animalimorsus]PAT33624.1 EamA family transporter [Vandammella animalimorsus]